MAKKEPPKEEEIGAPAWMLTYGDMVTLILTFFVLLLTMMVVDPKKFVEVLGTAQNLTGDGTNIITDQDPKKAEDYFRQIMRVSARRSDQQDGGQIAAQEGEAVRVFAFRDNFVVKMADQPFFEEFEIRLTSRAKDRLDFLADMLMRSNASNPIRVIGRYSRSESNFEAIQETVTGERQELTGIVRQFEVFDDKSRQLIPQSRLLEEPADIATYRARAVKHYLVWKGIRPETITEIAGGLIEADRVKSSVRSSDAFVIARNSGRFLRSLPAGQANVPMTEGTAESMDLQAPAAAGLEYRNWPQFIFTEDGSDSGRTVEVVITGELPRRDEMIFTPPMRE